MNEKIQIALTPVIDRQGAWGGVWIGISPDNAHVIANFRETLDQDVGRLNIFLDARGGLPSACFDAVPPEKTWIVGAGDLAALKPLESRGFHVATYGQQFVSGITDQAQLDAAKTSGAEWFCGDFLSHPHVVRGKKEAGRASLLKLLSLVAQDADSAEIEQVFKREPALSFNLFRLVNSVSMGLNTKISTFNQAIMVLGRRQMQRWIQLMLYTSNQTGSEASELLLQLAAMRARLMECLAIASGWSAAEQERAFMAGIFSLLDSLLGMSMAEIVNIISLPDDVQAALLGQEGQLSELLALVSSLQAGKADAVLPTFINLDLEKLAECQFNAMKWAAGMSREMG